MRIALTPEQQSARAAFRAFADAEVRPIADRYDQEEVTPPELVRALAQRGYLGAALPREHGGGGMDMITYGLLTEAIGRACSSLRSLLTVHGMVGQAILRWGSASQKQRWLPRLAAGEIIGAFALTEPDAGSDAKSIATSAARTDDSYLLNGHKKWITYAQLADVFLVFAQCDGKPGAFLVERDTPGLTVAPIRGMLGTRAAMLAELRFENCRIPHEHLVGRLGFGFDAVAASALDLGRYSVAWGCIGIAQACLDASLSYAAERKQFGVYLKDHQLIRQMLTDMIANVQAARLLCYQAGCLKDADDPGAITATLIAKYFGSTTAMKAAADAVQIHGALGCSAESPVQRYMRDAKIMEIIEGSTQIQQITIAKQAYQGYELPAM